MEIIGIGTDIIEIDRIAKVLRNNSRFASRVFTRSELDYCAGRRNRKSHLAARFAAKEAVAKAIGRPLSWQEVEIINGANGKPAVRLTGEAERAAEGCRVMLTMSHSRHYATASAIIVRSDEP